MDLTTVDWYTLALKLGWSFVGFLGGGELIGCYNLLVPVLICAWLAQKSAPQGHSLVEMLAPKAVWAQRSARLDAVYYVVIQAIVMLLLVPVVTVIVTATGSALKDGLVQLFGPAGPGTRPPNTLGEKLLYTTLVFIALDFGFFYSHYLSHRLPVLWCLHKVHHSPTVLVPFTAMRFHPLDMLWNMVWGGGCAALVAGVCQYLFYAGDQVLQLFTNNLWVGLSYLTIHNFRHSHVWIMFPPRLSRWLISPAQHQLHHSREKRHIDKNMGYLLAVWDRMFGTLYVPATQETFRMGVHGMPKDGFHAHHSIKSLLFAPLVEAARYLSGRISAAEVMGAAPKAGGPAQQGADMMERAGL